MSGTWWQSKVLRWHRYLQNKVNVRKVAKFLLCRYKSARNLFYAEIKLNKQGPRSVAYVVSLMLNSLVLDFTKHAKWLRYSLMATLMIMTVIQYIVPAFFNVPGELEKHCTSFFEGKNVLR